MADNVERRLLTDMLLAKLKTDLEVGGADEVKVGDHEAPDEGGWPDEEGVGEFVNYTVLTTLSAQDPVGPTGQPQQMVWFPYALTSIGASRRSGEHTADRARGSLVGLMRQDTAGGLRVQYIRVATYGAVERIDATEPPFYVVTDVVSAYTSQG